MLCKFCIFAQPIKYRTKIMSFLLVTTLKAIFFMATVTAFIRTSKTDKNKPVSVRFRLTDGRNFQLFHKSEFSVIPDKWDEVQQKIKAKCVFDEQERIIFDTGINERKKHIKDIYSEKGETLTSDLLNIEIDKKLHPEKYENPTQTFFDIFGEFLNKHKLSDVRKKNYGVVIRALKRYELYKQHTGNKSFKLDINTLTPLILTDFDAFLRIENTLFEKYPFIYKAVPESRNPKPRGQNTINGIFTKIRTFCIWAVDNEKTENNPFKKFFIPECVYGTPYYISVSERNELYNFDLSGNPELEKQRDIFVFQCLIGCRVSDLYKFTKKNIINGAIEYIARKTKEGRPVTIRVPLNSIANEILAKYADCELNTLLPYISEQQYNKAIKEMFTTAGLTRPVVILDPLTRESVIRPLNEIASTHLARRCFVGNLYRQVKDPNLVSALSGHKYGSEAFARYRDIDESMKQELVKMLE